VNQDDYLSNIKNEYNAVVVEAAFSDKQLFIGKGAGGHPTGSAVLSDISANAYDYKYEYKKANQGNKFVHTNNISVEVFISCTDKNLLERIESLSISEKGDNYIVADIALSELISLKDELESSGAMIIKRGEHKSLPTSLKKRDLAAV
jgi:homoserine dehydrogenase